ncbi:hypothetical protein Bca52824_081031 [Brassica carinata]|uniref:Uncharacterized protein n=1 Tax=Brassica carinata TaxID=52824 RepID=A0A8X7PGI4_BRACI|nr:hypothetical protein Bca52824_081031 [Brassica carinata]
MNQLQTSRMIKDNNTDVIPQTEAALGNKSNVTPEKRKDQEDDDISMEDGEFDKMVDYYNELGMTEEMIDEDDLLEDIVVPETQMVAVESESEQIEAIAQLGQKVISKDHTSNTRQNKESPDQNQSTLPQDGRIEQKTPRGLLKVHEKSGLKKVTPGNPDTKGIAASRKLAARRRHLRRNIKHKKSRKRSTQSHSRTHALFTRHFAQASITSARKHRIFPLGPSNTPEESTLISGQLDEIEISIHDCQITLAADSRPLRL